MDEKLKVDIKHFCENTLDKESTFGPKLSQDIQKELSRKVFFFLEFNYSFFFLIFTRTCGKLK